MKIIILGIMEIWWQVSVLLENIVKIKNKCLNQKNTS